MNTHVLLRIKEVVIGRGVQLLVMALVVSCAATSLEFLPVETRHATYLALAVEAPGTDGWAVAERRYKAGWRVIYRHSEMGDSSRTSSVFLKSDVYPDGKFVKENGSLEQLAQAVFTETRTNSTQDPRFTEKWAEMDLSDVSGVPAYRLRMAWEERGNRWFPGTVLVMENVQVLALHPQNPDQVVSVISSTRHLLGSAPLSADSLSTSFLAGVRFE